MTDQAEGMQEGEQTQAENNEEIVQFNQSGLATIVKAPVSWVALFAAIGGVTSLIPFYFYITGGGYISMGSGLFMPLAGQMLGPWAGTLAAFIGALIGMFLAPGAFPLGLIDVVLSGAVIGLSGGLVARKWKWWFLVWWLFNLGLIYVFPYRWPGEAINLAPPNEPNYTLSWWYVILAFVVWLALGPLTTDLLHKWSNRKSSKKKRIAGLILIGFISRSSMQPIWSLPFAFILRWPQDWVMVDNTVNFPVYAFNWVATGLLAFVVFRALWKTRLRRIPGSLVADLSD